MCNHHKRKNAPLLTLDHREIQKIPFVSKSCLLQIFIKYPGSRNYAVLQRAPQIILGLAYKLSKRNTIT